MATLTNLGSTCSINSILQVLSNLDIDLGELPKTKEGTLNRSLVEIVYLMKTNKGKNITPNRFIETLYKNLTMFMKGEQIDVQELFIMLSNQVFKETSVLCKENIFRNEAEREIMQHNENKTSVWNDIFQGVSMNKITCLECNNVICRYEPFYTVSLYPMGSIVEMLQDMFNKKRKDSDWTCDKCNSKNYETMLKIYKLPKYLVINMVRYTNTFEKINNDVIINEKINITKNGFMERNKDVKLEYCSSILHQGVMNGGHYYVNIDNAKIYDDSNIYDYNDNHRRHTYMVFYKVC